MRGRLAPASGAPLSGSPPRVPGALRSDPGFGPMKVSPVERDLGYRGTTRGSRLVTDPRTSDCTARAKLAQLPERSDRSSSAGAAPCGGPSDHRSTISVISRGLGSDRDRITSWAASWRIATIRRGRPLLLLNTDIFAPARRFDHPRSISCDPFIARSSSENPGTLAFTGGRQPSAPAPPSQPKRRNRSMRRCALTSEALTSREEPTCRTSRALSWSNRIAGQRR